MSKKIVLSCRTLYQYEGLAFGLDQPVTLCELRMSAITDMELSCFDELASRLLREERLPASIDGENQHELLVRKLHYWSARLQQQLNFPVFESCVVEQLGPVSKNGDLWRCRFAFPYVNSTISTKVLGWVFDVCNSTGDCAQSQDKEVPQQLDQKLSYLRKTLGRYSSMGTNMIHLLRAAHELDIPRHLLVKGIYCYGQGKNGRWLNSTITDQTSGLGLKVAGNKLATARVLTKLLFPTTRHSPVHSEEDALAVANRLGFPVVVKPADKDQGLGVFAGLASESSFLKAYRAAAEVSNQLMVEKHYAGHDYRFTVLHGRVIKIMARTPGSVVGDGELTVTELVKVAQTRKEYQRSFNRTGKMRLQLDDEALELLSDQGLTTDSVPAKKQLVLLRRKANISTGGLYEIIPVSDAHRDNCELCIRVASVLGLDIAGIDMILQDVKQSWKDTNGVILEVNAQPQIGRDQTPEIFKEILLDTVPGGGKIPLHIALVGEESASDPLGICARLANKLGCNGYSTANGYWIDGAQSGLVSPGSFHSAQAILLDRKLASGLLTMSASDILRFGLPANRFSSFQVVKDASWSPDNKSANKAVEFVRRHCGLLPSFIEVGSLETSA